VLCGLIVKSLYVFVVLFMDWRCVDERLIRRGDLLLSHD
jgi:hypothetical protein